MVLIIYGDDSKEMLSQKTWVLDSSFDSYDDNDDDDEEKYVLSVFSYLLSTRIFYNVIVSTVP